MKRVFLLWVALALLCPGAWAHEVRPAYLELHETAAETYDAFWKVPGRGADQRLGIDVDLPPDSIKTAPPRGVMVGNAFSERWSFKRSGGLTGQTIRIAGLEATNTDVLVRVERLDGTTQIARLTPSSPSFVVEASPSVLEVAGTYVKLGVEHILLGIDHLLFILGLLLLVKGWRRIVLTMTAFTATHSLTLTTAALGYVHVPQPPVEACIALSIMFVAREVVRSRQGFPGLTERWPWVVSFTFGLLHGFGFAGALSEVGLPQRAIPVALLFFNVGIEIGQLFFIASVLFAVGLIRQAIRGRTWLLPLWAESVPQYAIGTAAGFWLVQRLAAF